MRSWLFGVVVHPWMTQDPEGFVWLAQVLRQRGRELSRGVGMVQEVLGGVADEGVSPELVGVFAAIEQAASACEVLAQALGEHGVQVARLVGELESLPVGRWWQVGRLRDELRVHTDALSQVDVRVRELVQECVRGVPQAGVRRWSQVLGVRGVGSEVAVGSRAECAGLALPVLRVAVLGDPRVRVRFAREGLESVGLG
ncbi:hypothetical protein GZ178_01645, partial [Dermatophilus congolensis]